MVVLICRQCSAGKSRRRKASRSRRRIHRPLAALGRAAAPRDFASQDIAVLWIRVSKISDPRHGSSGPIVRPASNSRASVPRQNALCPPADPGDRCLERSVGRRSASLPLRLQDTCADKPEACRATSKSTRHEGRASAKPSSAARNGAEWPTGDATVDLRAPHRHCHRPFRPVAIARRRRPSSCSSRQHGGNLRFNGLCHGARSTAVSGSAVTPGWCSATTLSSVIITPCLRPGGFVTPHDTPPARHPLSAIALACAPSTTCARA